MPSRMAQVRTLALTSDSLFVGGDFATISGQDQEQRRRPSIRQRGGDKSLGRWDLHRGQGQVRTVVPVGQAVYIGGQFTGAGGENRKRIASVHPLFGAASGWDPGADAPISAIARNDNVILIGGEFTRLGLHGANPNPAVDGQPVPYLAAFDAHPAIHNFRKGAPGHYQFEITDGDGLGSTLLIQASDTLSNPSWQTLKSLDVLGIQDPYDDGTVPAGATSRFYRLQRQP